MVDTTPSTSPAVPSPEPRKKRRWLRVILILLVLLVVGLGLLIVLAPTLLSTTPGKNLALSVVNGQLNGRADIASWSIGWTSGVKLDDVKVYEKTSDGERLVLSVGKITSPISVLGLAKGNYDIGDTVIQSPNLVNCEIDANGVSNYQKLLKTAPDANTSPQSGDAAPAKLPDLKGSLTINDLRGTLSGHGIPEPVHIESSNVALKITDINQPISNDVKLAIRVGQGQVGTVALAGSLKAITNNVVDVTKLTGKQKITIANLDLGSATPFVQMSGQQVTLGGLVNGDVNLDAVSMDDLALAGQIDIASLAAGGAALKGDTFRSSKLSVPLDVRRSLVNGVAHVDIKTLKIAFDQGTVGVTGSAPEPSLIAAGDLVPAAINNALLGVAPTAPVTLPGGGGTVALTADLDLAAIVKQLPNTVALAQGVTLTSGRLQHTTNIVFKPDAVAIDSSTKLPDVAGTNAGRAVKLSPIDLSAKATATGGASPDVRDIAVGFTSDFATLNGGGAALAQEEWKGNFDLTKLRGQLDQFVDLNQLLAPKVTAGESAAPLPAVEIGGTGEFVLNVTGDLTKPGGTIGSGLQLALANFVARNAFGLNTASPQSLVVRYHGDLARGKATALESIKNLLLEVGNGTLQQPAIALTTKGDATFTSTPGATKDAAPTLALGAANLRVDAPNLPVLSALANGFMPAIVPVQLTSGSLGTQVSASMSGQSMKIDVSELKLSGLAMKANASNAAMTFDKDITLVLSAAVNKDPSGALQSIDVSKLSGDLGGLATLSMPKAIAVSNLTAATPSAAGTINLTGNIDRVCRFLEAVGGLPQNTGYPYSGDFNVTQTLNTAGNKITLAGNIDATNFKVFQNGQPVFSEPKMAVTNNVTVNPANKVVRDLKLNVSMPNSQALAVDLSGDRLDDWEKKRQLTNFVAKVDYDLEKLWPIIKPQLTAEQQASYADLKLAGKFSRTFNISGAYPAAATWQQSIKSLKVTGGIALALVDLPSKGIKLTNLDRPFVLENGILSTDFGEPNPKFATVNGGTLNTNNLSIDLNGPTPRLTTPANKRLLKGVQVPPLFAQSFLAKTIPLFGGQSDAGTLDVTFAECNRLPLGALLMLPRDPTTGEENDGRAVIMLAAKNVKPGGELISQVLKVASFAGVGGVNGNSLQGEIPEGSKVIIDRGVVTQDITLAAGEKDRPLLHLGGDVNLQALTFSNFNVGIPGQLISRLGGDLKKYAPDMLNVPLTGSVSAPHFAADQIVGKLVGDAGKKFAAEQAMNLLGGKKENAQQPANGQQPGNNAAPGTNAPAAEKDPIGGLLDVFQKAEKDKQEKKREKEEQRKQP